MQLRARRAILLSTVAVLLLAAPAAAKPPQASESGSSTKKHHSTTSVRARSSAHLKKPATVSLRQSITMHGTSRYRGWDYLVERLRRDGMTEVDLASIFQNQRMPWFTEIPFAIAPREAKHSYQGFKARSKLDQARQFLDQHKAAFDEAEATLKVSRYAVAALLLIETQFGQNTGKELVIHRLARLASVGDPQNLTRNYERLRRIETGVTMEKVAARARYLEETFYPEVRALLQIAREQKLDLFAFKGSSAGAFGIPQFLPSSYLKFAVDANDDGHVNLFDEPDAIWSTANFLASFGWRDDLSDSEKRKVFWRYNHSDAYVDTALELKTKLRLHLAPEPPLPQRPVLRSAR